LSYKGVIAQTTATQLDELTSNSVRAVHGMLQINPITIISIRI